MGWVAFTVADAIEDGSGAVRRAARQGGAATEKFLNDATQRHPASTIAAAWHGGRDRGTVARG